ncbi:hypothetical protein NQZ68_005661 [Dissostichus eleginoides]|nr:hypothetical protein NQZ68_005661 [Dissostichus eleginoides]
MFVCATCAFTEPQQMHWEWMMGKQAVNLEQNESLRGTGVRLPCLVIDKRAVAVKGAECHGMPRGGSGRKRARSRGKKD